tara:strand:- start:157 stop:963 length:807 start_codon:yes stop_codon:yes gene_type:complete
MKINKNFSYIDLFNLNKKVVVVTGASGQIGTELVQGLLDNKATVIGSDKNIDFLMINAKERKWNKKYFLPVKCNITNLDEVKNLFFLSKKKFKIIDALINNAGIAVFKPFIKRTEQEIDDVVNVNIKGTIFCIQEFLKIYNKNKSVEFGNIVNIASLYGLVSPDPKIYTDTKRNSSEIYGATKAGIIQLTKYFAVHASNYNVKVNSVSPGGILSNQGKNFIKNYSRNCPIGRMANINEIIGSIIFLLSPAASYINGHNLIIDGGFTSW